MGSVVKGKITTYLPKTAVRQIKSVIFAYVWSAERKSMKPSLWCEAKRREIPDFEVILAYNRKSILDVQVKHK